MRESRRVGGDYVDLDGALFRHERQDITDEAHFGRLSRAMKFKQEKAALNTLAYVE